MQKLLVCIDGSAYADNICTNASWIAQQLDAEIDLLHVLRRHSDYEASHDDHTGAIGLGASSELLEKLTQVDEERGRLEQQKGKVVLDHGVEVLQKSGVKKVNTLHRRGALVDTVKELEDSVDMIVMGKRGETADLNSVFLGSNLEKIARAIHKPLFVVSSVVRPIKKFLIAYDGKNSVQKAVDYVTTHPLLKGVECHLLAVEHHNGDIDTSATEKKLLDAGFKVTTHKEINSNPTQAITTYVEENGIDLLVTGAYSHSKLHDIFLGSTTASLIKSCHVPLLLFR